MLVKEKDTKVPDVSGLSDQDVANNEMSNGTSASNKTDSAPTLAPVLNVWPTRPPSEQDVWPTRAPSEQKVGVDVLNTSASNNSTPGILDTSTQPTALPGESLGNDTLDTSGSVSDAVPVVEASNTSADEVVDVFDAFASNDSTAGIPTVSPGEALANYTVVDASAIPTVSPAEALVIPTVSPAEAIVIPTVSPAEALANDTVVDASAIPTVSPAEALANDAAVDPSAVPTEYPDEGFLNDAYSDASTL